jgi:hypothetical protein
MLPIGWLALASCMSSGSTVIPDVPLVLEVTSPTYGQFAGGSSVRVTGRVQPAVAAVTVENRAVNVGSDGSFAVDLPIAGDYRNVDVRAFFRESSLRERIPVFAGEDPLQAFPGGLGVRITPRLLADLADQIAAGVDESGWAASVLEGLPSLDTEGLRIVPVAFTHRPAEATLVPDADGLALELRIRDLELDLDAGWLIGDTWVDADSEAGFGAVVVRARLAVEVGPDGLLVLGVSGGDVEFLDPRLQLGSFDGGALTAAVQFVGDLLAGLGDLLLGLVLGGVGEVPLGGPFAFDADLLGTPLSVSLAGLGTDPEGIWLDLGLGLGGPVPDPLVVHRPTLAEGGPDADLVLAVHEGLLAPLAQSEILDLLSQDLELGGILGAGIGLVFTNLPGGDDAPDADAWCLTVSPGDARAVKLGGRGADGRPVLGHLYLPDLGLEVGISHDGIDCDPWLEVSLAVDATLVVDGSRIGIELAAPDGAVRFYAAPGEHDEAEIVGGLGSLFGLLVGLAGGSLSFDLAELLGGEVPPAEGSVPYLLGARAIEDVDGEVVPGLFALAIDLR